jgi:hypothetical protein
MQYSPDVMGCVFCATPTTATARVGREDWVVCDHAKCLADLRTASKALAQHQREVGFSDLRLRLSAIPVLRDDCDQPGGNDSQVNTLRRV